MYFDKEQCLEIIRLFYVNKLQFNKEFAEVLKLNKKIF